ncbi:MAG TPA: glutamyl-tRNA reductase [Candidatus Limnocylindria bacterium]|nr:glutamyl-tRNA reductase [Candidatus Limnocylindria bacterium]
MSDGARFALLSLHQRDAGVDVRERLTAQVSALASADVLMLATCHRCEVALVLPADGEPATLIAARLDVAIPVEATVRIGHDAVLHLVRVACGLDSVIRGEGQILGQLRRTFDDLRAAGPLHPMLATVTQRVLRVGRELRRVTALGTVRRTVGSLAVDAALADCSDERAATVLVIGAGEVGKLTLRALASRVGTIVVANRDVARAASLAHEHGATAVALSDIDEPLLRASAVIAAADTRGAVITRERLGPRLARGPLTLVDLAVPRSVDADARSLEGLRYLDVDDLSDAAAPELDAASVADIEARCAAATAVLMTALHERDASVTIRALRERAEVIRVRQLERALARLSHLSGRDRRVVESLSEGLAHALIHEPTVRLRRSPEHEPAARDLFAL